VHGFLDDGLDEEGTFFNTVTAAEGEDHLDQMPRAEAGLLDSSPHP
jgi:hypothetical protein